MTGRKPTTALPEMVLAARNRARLRTVASALALAIVVPIATVPLHGPGPAWAQSTDATDLLFGGVETGDLQTVRESLLAGADMTAKNAQGRTAADLAVDLGHFQIAQFLLAVKSYADANTDQTLAEAIQAVVGGRTATSGAGRDVSGVLASGPQAGRPSTRSTPASRITASDDLFGASTLGLQPAPTPTVEPDPLQSEELDSAQRAMDAAMAEVGDLMSRLEGSVDTPVAAPTKALPKAPEGDVSGLLGDLTTLPETPDAVSDVPAPAAEPKMPPAVPQRLAADINPAPRKPATLAKISRPTPKPAPLAPENVFDGMAETLGLAPLESVETPGMETAPDPAPMTAESPETIAEPVSEPMQATVAEPESAPQPVAKRRQSVTQPPPGFPLPPGVESPNTAMAEQPAETMPSSTPQPAAPSAVAEADPEAAEAEDEGGLLDQVFDLFGSDPEAEDSVAETPLDPDPKPESIDVAETAPEIAAEPEPETVIEVPDGFLTETPEAMDSAVPSEEPDKSFDLGAVDEPTAPAGEDDGGFLSSLRELVEPSGPEATEEEIDELLTEPMTDEQRVLRERARAKFAADTEARGKELERIAAEQKAEREARAAERLARAQAEQRRLDERRQAIDAGDGAAVARVNPGHVAPPDGGTSGERFFNRLGSLFGIDPDPEPASVRDAEAQSVADAIGEPGPRDTRRMLPRGETAILPRSPGGQAKSSSETAGGGLIDQISDLFAVEGDPRIAATGPVTTDPAIAAPTQTTGVSRIAPSGQALPVRGGRGQSAATQPLPDETVDFFDRLAQNLGLDPTPAPDPAASVRDLPAATLLADPATETAPAPAAIPTATVAEADLPVPAPTSPDPADDEFFGEDIVGNLPGDEEAESGFWGESDAPDTGTGLFAEETEPPGAFDRAPQPGQLDVTGEVVAQPAIPSGPPPSRESWTVKNVQTARLPPEQATDEALNDVRTETLLSGAGLLIGEQANLGRPLPSVFDQKDLKKSCLFKRRNTITVCIEPLDWPETLAPMVLVNTVMYQGLNAIVRYDKGVATRYHVLFPSEAFDTVISHYVDKYGSPSEVWRRTIAPLAAPREENPTVLWRNMNPATQALSTLEIRKFDDTRGGFPDTRRGVLMLYAATSDPVFPQVSSLELMRLRPLGAPQ